MKLKTKLKIGLGMVLVLGIACVLFWLSTVDYEIKNNEIDSVATLKIIEKEKSKYLADKDEVWQMLLENYSIQRTEDRYVTMKEIEDAERKLNIDTCDLLGIAIKESSLNQFDKGDSGYSWGVYQINSYYHDISERTAYMIDSASDWTYANLISNGYPASRVYAIAKHNGSINKQAVQAYAFRVLLVAERICSLK